MEQNGMGSNLAVHFHLFSLSNFFKVLAACICVVTGMGAAFFFVHSLYMHMLSGVWKSKDRDLESGYIL